MTQSLTADWCVARPRSTFVELGALDGNKFSNTNMLERCFNWTGLLVEANPENARALMSSSRSRSAKVHSAVCSRPGHVRMTRGGKEVAGQLGAMSAAHVRTWSQWNGAGAKGRGAANATVDVPCRPLPSLMASAGLRGATFLSLDVEGAEELVVSTIDPLDFAVVMVEMDGTDAAKDERVHALLLSAGLSYSRRLAVRFSRVYLRPRRAATLKALRRRWDARADARQRAAKPKGRDAAAVTSAAAPGVT